MGGETINTATARLALQLQGLSATSMVALSASAGVDGVIGARARRGRRINATSYLLLCSLIGIDATTGASSPAICRRGFEIDWHAFGAALKVSRNRANLDLRAAAKIIGASAATLSRAECGNAVSVESYLLINRFLVVSPLVFLSFTG